MRFQDKIKKLDLNINLSRGGTLALQLSKLLNHYYRDDSTKTFSKNIDKDFQKLILKATNRGNDILIKEFVLLGLDRAYSLNLGGLLSRKNQSKITGELRQKKIRAPFVYIGRGMRLEPMNKMIKLEEKI